LSLPQKSKVSKWKLEGSKILSKSPWFNLRRDTCILPNGLKISDYYVGESPDYCMVVALNAQGRLLLAREYKHAVGEVILQLPAGYVGRKETARRACLRELEEETGFKAGKLESLGDYFPSPGRLDNRMHLFLATQLKPGKRHWDDSEQIQIEEATPQEALQLIRSGRIKDQASVTGILLYLNQTRFKSRKSSL
jgi:8-oxo-dGTP pyrophosphatase MutT (NUDIX family)